MSVDINKIGSLRKAKGLTQSELGERLKVSFQAMSKWEEPKQLYRISNPDHILT